MPTASAIRTTPAVQNAAAKTSGGGLQLPSLATASLAAASSSSAGNLESDTRSLVLVSSTGAISRVAQAPALVVPPIAISVSVGTAVNGGAFVAALGSLPAAQGRLVFQASAAPQFLRVFAELRVAGAADTVRVYGRLYNLTQGPSGTVYASGALFNAATPMALDACGDTTAAKARVAAWYDYYDISAMGSWANGDAVALQVFVKATGDSSVTLAGALLWTYATPDVAALQTAPASFAVTSATASSLTLGWAAPTVTPDHYVIEFDPTVGSGPQTYSQSLTVAGAATAGAISGLVANTSYALRIRSTSTDLVTSAYATLGNATTWTAPLAPTALTLGSTTATTQALGFTPPTTATNLTYAIKYSTHSDMSSATTSVATISGNAAAVGSGGDAALAWSAANTYYWTVTATSSVSGRAATSSTLTPSAPPAVVSLTPSGVTSTTTTLSWPDPGGALWNGFAVKYGTSSPSSTWAGSAPTLAAGIWSVTLSGLTGSTLYYYSVAAQGPGGGGSAAAATATTAAAAPYVASSIAVTAGTYACTFSRTSSATANATLAVKAASGGATVATFNGTPTWTSAGSYTVNVTSANTSGWTAPVDGSAYYFVLTDATDAATATSGNGTYTAPYNTLSVGSNVIGATTYYVTFTRTATATAAAGVVIKDASSGNAVVATFTGSATWTAAGTTSNFALTSGNCSGFTGATSGHNYFAVLSDATDNGFSLASGNTAYTAPYATPSVSSVTASTYNVSVTRNAAATANATLVVKTAGGATVATFSGTPTWTSAGTYAVAVTSSNSSGWTAPVDGTSYTATLADATDGSFTATSSSAAYTAPYNTASVASVSITTYAVTFTRAASATAAAGLVIKDASNGNAVVATFTGSATWTTAGTTTAFALTTGNCSGFSNPTAGHAYFVTLSDATDDSFTLSSGSTTYAPYNTPSVSSVTASTYNVSITRNASATANATLVIKTAGGSTVATFNGTATWTTAGTFAVAVTSSNSSGWTAPVDGTSYTATLADATDGSFTATSSSTAYTAPYNAASVASVTNTTYAVTFTRAASATAAAGLAIKDASNGNAVVATFTGSATWTAAGTTTAFALNSGNCSGFVVPSPGHAYFLALSDATDDGFALASASTLYTFTPTLLSGCVGWFDAQDSSAASMTLSGSTVTTWKDKSGSGNNAAASGAPTLTSSGYLNGYAGVSTGTGKYFGGSVSITGSALTVFAVAYTNANLPPSTDQRLVSLEGGGGVDYGGATGVVALFSQAGTSTISTWRQSGPNGANTIYSYLPLLATSMYDGTNGYLWLNSAPGGTVASAASTGTFGITKFGIGNQANPSGEYWYGDIGEVIIYNRALTSAERLLVEAALRVKWLPYTAPVVASVTAGTYNVTFLRNSCATANATLAIQTAGGATVATFNGTPTWTSTGAYAVAVTSANSSGWAAPVDGTSYTATLVDATNNFTCLSTAATTYTAPYDAISLANITSTSYAVTFTRNASASAAAGVVIKDASSGNAVVATFTGSATWTAAGTTSAFALTSGNCSGFTAPTLGHSYFAVLSDATDDSFSASSASTAYTAYATPSMTSVTASTYNVSITRNAAATANATLVIKTAGGATVATFNGTPTWTSAGTYAVAVTSSNTSGWTAPVGGTSYTATLADATDGSFAATSSSAAYTAPYNTASVASISSTTYAVTFTRSATATAAAGLVIKDTSSGNAVVATFTGSATWTAAGTTTAFALTSGNCSGFVAPTSGHAYFLALSDATDDGFALSTGNTTYTLPYNTPSVSSVTANTYNVSITRNASATANATLVVKTAGGTTVATFNGTPTWTSAGTYAVAVTSSNSSGWTAPVDGTSYTATLADATDGSFTATSSSTAYTAPYNTASVASVSITTYAVTFTRAASATAAAGLVIKDASNGNAVVATFTGSATWTTAGTTTAFALTSGNCSGFTAPTAGHAYFLALSDATDDSFTLSTGSTTYAPYNTPSVTSVNASTYNVSITRNASATANATLVIKTAGGATVATFNGTPTWTSAGTYAVAVTSGNTSGWTAPVDGTSYTATLADATDGSFTATSSSTAYTAPYNTASVASVSITTYAVTFTRSATATVAAGLTIKDASNGNAVVATFSGSATWTTTGTTTAFALTSGNCSGFTAPTAGHAYFLSIFDATDGTFTLNSGNTTYAPYNTPSVSSVTANTYNVSITRNASATANATLVVKTAGGTTVATFNGTPTWTSAGTYAVAVTSSNTSGWTAPVDGTSYTATIADATDGSFTATSSSTAYTAPYSTLSVGATAISATTYYVTFTRSASATAAAGIVIKDASNSNAVVATFSGSATWTAAGTTSNFALTSGNCSGFSAPTSTHNYFAVLSDSTDDTFTLTSGNTTYTSASYAPTAVTSATCEVCYDASIGASISRSAGNNVSSWTDQSTNNLTATTQATGSKNITVVPTWDGSSNYITFAATSNTAGAAMLSGCEAAGQTWEFFFVGQVTSISNSWALGVFGGCGPSGTGNYGGLEMRIASSAVQINDAGHTNYLSNSVSGKIAANTTFVMNVRCTGNTTSSLTTYYATSGTTLTQISGTNASATNFAANQASAVLLLGGRGASGNVYGEFHSGQFAFLAKYNAVLNSTDRANIMTYLNTTFGV